VDRGRPGSKHNVLVDVHGVPVAVILTEANRHDVTQMLPLLDAVPPIRGKPGGRVRRPGALYADRGYDSPPHRRAVRARGIVVRIARRGVGHGSGLGKVRWVVERTISWLHQFRRLARRYDIRADIHEAFLRLAAALICWRVLRRCL